MGGRLPSLPRLPRILFAKRAKQNALRAPPYGAVIADLGMNLSAQQYKFGGKELTTANGLNEYDFGARQYYQAIPGFTSIDPMCEKYYWLSPYTYCANNPVNAIGTIKHWTKDEQERAIMDKNKRCEPLEKSLP